jgi:hypothetical protein
MIYNFGLNLNGKWQEGPMRQKKEGEKRNESVKKEIKRNNERNTENK